MQKYLIVIKVPKNQNLTVRDESLSVKNVYHLKIPFSIILQCFKLIQTLTMDILNKQNLTVKTKVRKNQNLTATLLLNDFCLW